MWNQKNYFLIGCTLYVQMLCYGTNAVGNSTKTGQDSIPTAQTSQTSNTTPQTSQKSNTTAKTSQISDITAAPSQNSNTGVPIGLNSNTAVSTGQNSFMTVATSQNSSMTTQTSQKSKTTAITSQKSNTTAKTSQISNITTAPSQHSETSVPIILNSSTPVSTGQNSSTTVATGQNSNMTAQTSQKSKTTAITSQKSNTTAKTSQISNITTAPSQHSETRVPIILNSSTPVSTGQNSFATVATGQNSNMTAQTSQKFNTGVSIILNFSTPVSTGQNSHTTVPRSQNSSTTVATGQNSNMTAQTSQKVNMTVQTSQNSSTTVPTSQNSNTTAKTSQISITIVPTGQISKNESHVSGDSDIAVYAKDKVPVKVELVVRINETFSNDLKDKTSLTYKKYKKEFKTQLEEVYETMKNFLRIDVIGFRNGSIICDYAVILTPGSVTHTGKEDDFKELQDQTAKLNSTRIFDSVMISPNSSIAKVLQENNWSTSCYGIDCGSGYSCDKVVDDSVTCKHICATSNTCQHGAECLFDPRHEQLHCRCKQDSNYMYSGDYCEVKVEKFTMSKTNIIAIAAGAGGGVVLLLLVVIVALGVKYRRRQTGKQRDGKPDSLRSVSMDDLGFEHGNTSRSSDGFLKRPKIHAAENPYQSGLPETKYVQGREHKVMKDDTGQETYLYQPSNHVKRSSESSVVSSSYTDHINKYVHDYIDTDSKFEIQRPNIRPGYLDKF